MVPEGTPCATPDQQIGPCVSILTCEPLLQLLKKKSNDPEARSYLQKSVCGYNRDNTPRVCCSEATSKSLDDEGGGSSNKPKDKQAPTDDTNSNSAEPLAGLLSPPDCGFSNHSASRVVGGVPAKLGQFPWMVVLGYRNPRNPNRPKWLCGGTMITDVHILTAAHCVYRRNDLYLARLGELDLYDDNDGATPEDIPIAQKKIHEDYNTVQFTNDIAILTIERKTRNPKVWPICLPHAEPLRSQSFEKLRPFVAGWGAINFRGPQSSILQVAEIPVVPTEKCKNAFAVQPNILIDERTLCAGWTTGEKDACQGDSGGPLMHGRIEEEDIQRYYQIGVVSFGFKCAEPNFPGAYTRVTYFIDWIQRNIS
ncbi:unnamed protein product [Acanthoscelides obtectus]|uniref:CLIP domain-containing serine protease n=1 Tax=Acanthoscelides obtectus TaxID=200917 RepID=A0A9P0JL28_ACAOB|nr:unnamed protein product [Acanthoscelides obtectus]CAK1628895.1 hypothetical protein AOBTE_LOCUS5454 [Acanthoscelides obtectus]